MNTSVQSESKPGITERVCECGCKTSFVPSRRDQRFFSPACRVRALKTVAIRVPRELVPEIRVLMAHQNRHSKRVQRFPAIANALTGLEDEIIKRGASFLYFWLLEAKPTFEREEDFRAETEKEWQLRRQRIRESARL